MKVLNRLWGFIMWYFTEYVNKSSVENVYTSLSKNGYDDIVGFESRTEALKNLVRDFNFRNKIVLDLACGTGAFIQAVIDSKPKKVVGVDLTAGMLDVAKKRLARHKNIQFIHQSFTDVQFSQETFDYILLANASRYIPYGKEEIFFTNIRRWLKPEGVFVLLSDNVFGYSTFGRLVSRLVYGRLIKDKVNPNTTADWALKELLPRYFRIRKTIAVRWEQYIGVKHTAFFCSKYEKQ